MLTYIEKERNPFLGEVPELFHALLSSRLRRSQRSVFAVFAEEFCKNSMKLLCEAGQKC
jgi:hypothetical protein